MESMKYSRTVLTASAELNVPWQEILQILEEVVIGVSRLAGKVSAEPINSSISVT